MNEISLPSSYDQALQNELRASIAQWHEELSGLLPTLPAEIDIEFDNHYLTPDFGTGGAAWNSHTMKLAYDPGFDASPEALLDELKATYYHEGYHLARGFSFATTPPDLPAVHLAIEEGLAARFETTHTDQRPGYAEYEDRDTMLAWLEEVKALPDGFDYDWQRWKFYDAETDRKWVLYKVGAFISDEALRNDFEHTIESLCLVSAADILKLSGL